MKYTDQLAAEKLFEYIARDYLELSHDKIIWQRNDWRKICESWLENQKSNQS